MATPLEQHRAEMKQLAYPAVKQFIATHPQYAIAPDQSGSDSFTNYIIFGQLAHASGEVERVIFKYFCEDERKAREVYALNHFSYTGIVPRLIADVGPRLIVQSYIPGGWLPAADDATFGEHERDQAGYTLGQAVATLLSVPLPASAAHEFERRFYDGLTLERYLQDILDASWQIHQSIEPYSATEFGASLTNLDAHLPYILAQPRVLYHQDALNAHFLDYRFVGFFDLEMCRVGTVPLQIGALWHIFATYGNWRAFARGYADVARRELTTRDFAAAQAFADFLVWRYVSRYGRWRGDMDDVENHAQAVANAAHYANTIALNHSVTF